MSILKITNLSHSFGEKVLYRNASLTLETKEHMGIVGSNGSGKSTLLLLCMGKLIPNEGDIYIEKDKTIGYLDQYVLINQDLTIEEYLKLAFKKYYETEKNMYKLYDQYAKKGEEKYLKKAMKLQNILDAKEFYQIDTKINKVALGLGITNFNLDTKVKDLSGGQRAKVILAKLLLEEPDLLLLDEPTNFLDENHINWLKTYLINFKNAFLVISHDTTFLNDVCNCICDLDLNTLNKYKGSYNSYLKQKKELQLTYERQYEKEQKHILKEEEFIRKNKAGSNSKMARGRQKQLDRLERMLPPTNNKKEPDFTFKEKDIFDAVALNLKNGSVGYTKPLLKNINIKLRGKEKIALTGFNGLGKTTLLKTLMQEIPLLEGNLKFNSKAHIAYYEQDLIFESKEETPLEAIQNAYPDYTQKEVRASLSKVGLTKEQVNSKIKKLSGGEQAKLKLCLLLGKQYNILVLDEPTNHLDIKAKQALKKSLQKFSGMVILVTHEPDFCKDLVDYVIDIEKYKI